MLLLRNARTTTHTHDEVISHVAHHATRYDITSVAHRFFAENPGDQRDIRHDFGSLVPPDGDTYFEFGLPPYIRLGQRLLLDQSGVRTAGVLVQRYAREDLAGIEYLVCALPYWMQRRARKRTTQLLRATFLLELLGDKPTVFEPVMRHDDLLGENGLPVVPTFLQRFTNAAITGHDDKEVYLPYRSLHFPVFEAVRLLREGRGSKEAKEAVAEVWKASQTDPPYTPPPPAQRWVGVLCEPLLRRARAPTVKAHPNVQQAVAQVSGPPCPGRSYTGVEAAMTRPPTPSPFQEAIFRFALKGSGHGVIMATAGSGKSTTLVEVAHRLPKDTRACFLAFNTAAAQQLKDRLPRHVTARTVHALGLGTLAASVKGRKLARVYPRKYQELINARLRNTESSFRVSSQTAAQAVQYLRELTHYARVNLAQEEDRGVLERLGQRYHLRPPDHPELLGNLHAQLWEILQDGVALALHGLYDYTDMIYAPLTADLSLTQHFDMVCVDEAQDLSPMQLSFILRLPCPGGRLLFVGDPKQAIYGLARADTRAMSRIVERTQATVLPLSVTYRCPQKHVRLAQWFAPAIQAAPGVVEGRMTAQVLGSDIAGKLLADSKLVLKQGLENWKAKLSRFEAREVEGIKQAKLPQDVTERMVYRREDELACLRAVVEDAVQGCVTTLEGLEARIDDLFGDARGIVTLSTVHRAKGKEAENVFILLPHLMPLPNAETPEEREAEDCVRFVAVTRAKQKLPGSGKP